MKKKDNKVLSNATNAFLFYKFRWIIIPIVLVIIIVLGIMIHDVDKKLNNEARENGYDSFFDDIKYDTWTGEMIHKDKINTYNNDYKYIEVNGNKVYFYLLKNEIENYEKIQGQYMYIKEENKEEIQKICYAIFSAYLNIEFEIKSDSADSLYRICLKNFDANGVHYENYNLGATSDLKEIIKDIVKGIYREQNNLKLER